MKLLVLTLLCVFHMTAVFGRTERRVINVEKFGVFPSSNFETDKLKNLRWEAIDKAFKYCILNGCNLYFPVGEYDVGSRNFPFRNVESSNSLLDCKGIEIIGEGPRTIFMTSSHEGADVIQLNKVKNIIIKNISVTARQHSFHQSGSNGISITYGWDNIILKNILCFNLPGVDKGGWIDGSKALTIQFDKDIKLKKGTLIAHGITSLNNAYGFRFDGRYVNEIMRWNPLINVKIKVIRGYQGISIAFGSSNSIINFKNRMNFEIDADLENCQQGVIFARVVGGKYNFTINNTFNKSKLIKNNLQKAWVKNDIRTFAFLGQAPKYANISLVGNPGNVDTLVMLGAIGNIVEPYNYKNLTEECSFYFNLAGNAKHKFILIEDYNMQSIINSAFVIGSNYKLPSNLIRKITSKPGIIFTNNE